MDGIVHPANIGHTHAQLKQAAIDHPGQHLHILLGVVMSVLQGQLPQLLTAGLRNIVVMRQFHLHQIILKHLQPFLLIFLRHGDEHPLRDTMELAVLHDAGTDIEVAFARLPRLHRNGFLLAVERDAERFKPAFALVEVADHHGVVQHGTHTDGERLSRLFRHLNNGDAYRLVGLETTVSGTVNSKDPVLRHLLSRLIHPFRHNLIISCTPTLYIHKQRIREEGALGAEQGIRHGPSLRFVVIALDRKIGELPRRFRLAVNRPPILWRLFKTWYKVIGRGLQPHHRNLQRRLLRHIAEIHGADVEGGGVSQRQIVIVLPFHFDSQQTTR